MTTIPIPFLLLLFLPVPLILLCLSLTVQNELDVDGDRNLNEVFYGDRRRREASKQDMVMAHMAPGIHYASDLKDEQVGWPGSRIYRISFTFNHGRIFVQT